MDKHSYFFCLVNVYHFLGHGRVNHTTVVYYWNESAFNDLSSVWNQTKLRGDFGRMPVILGRAEQPLHSQNNMQMHFDILK